ncbi:hypothetical protein [Chryseobacterium sp.]|uniref:hypothetical protein n=1 Tax=Chryseobacterium sp. TaxID=1871047 RepID=UPI0026241171|nr:hypothetical protein [Chryseobacterium sp.]
MVGSPSNAGLPTHTRQKIKTYDKICVFQKARRPQRIVHPIVTRHDTLCDKAGLEKMIVEKLNSMKIKTAWDSTISVIEVLVYLAHR